MKYNDKIGKNIKYYRLEKGLTQKTLADKIGITWEMISRYEREKSTPLRHIQEIADALDVPIAKLLQKDCETRAYNQQVESLTSDIIIPYFIRKPKNLLFTRKHTKYIYLTPPELTLKYPNLIAVDLDIVKVKTIQIGKKGVVFVDTNANIKPGDVILYVYEHNIFIDTNTNLTNQISLVGKVIAQFIQLD